MNVVITPAPLTGAVRVPASKSAAHRLLIAAALADALDAPVRPAQSTPWNWRRRRVGDAPAGHRSRRRIQRVSAIPGRPPQEQGHRTAAFCRELEPARLGHLHAFGFAHHGSQTTMSQAFLQQCQQFRIVLRFCIDNPAGGEPCLVQAWREQVARSHHPEHVPLRSCRDPRHEQDCRGIVPPA